MFLKWKVTPRLEVGRQWNGQEAGVAEEAEAEEVPAEEEAEAEAEVVEVEVEALGDAVSEVGAEQREEEEGVEGVRSPHRCAALCGPGRYCHMIGPPQDLSVPDGCAQPQSIFVIFRVIPVSQIFYHSHLELKKVAVHTSIHVCFSSGVFFSLGPLPGGWGWG